MHFIAYKTRGFSLIELLLVVFLVGLAVTLVALGLTTWGKQNKNDETQRSVMLLRRNIHSYYQGIEGYANLSVNNIVRLNLDQGTPITRVTSSTQATVLLHPYGGSMTVSGTATDFDITLSTLSRDACEFMATALGSDSYLEHVRVQSTTYPAEDVADAGGSCSAGGQNTVTYRFR